MAEQSNRTIDRVLPTAIAAAVFCVYAAGACRTIYVGDSGELVTAVGVLGIPHPSGYPLYVLAGKLWSLIVPVGSLAFRMSLFSAACAATACALLYRLCRSIDAGPAASLFAAALFAFSPSFWSQANVQRVYALGAIFVVAATIAAIRWYQSREPWRLYLAFFLCGLGATNHTFMGVYAVVLALFALSAQPALVKNVRALVGCGGATLVGLLPYLYLPIRSRFDPVLDWGNPETLEGFRNVVLRKGFWERAWLEQPGDLLTLTGDYLGGLGTELTWAGVALALLGLVRARHSSWPVRLPLMIMAANLLSLALHGSRSDIFIWHRYYIPSYAMAAVLAGYGCQQLITRLPRAAAVLPFLVPAFLLVDGWNEYNRSRYRIAEEFSLTVLDSLPPGANLVATDDNVLFVLMYLHLAEGRRPDINLILQGVGDADLPPLRFNPDEDPLFFTHHPNWTVPGLEIVPMGVVMQARRAGTPWPELNLPAASLDGENDDSIPKDYLTQNLIGLFHYMLGFSYEQREWTSARQEFVAAARAAPKNDVLFYNLGLVYARNGLLDDALEAFERSREINPRHLASKSRPRASERISETKREQARLAEVESSLKATPSLAGLTEGTRDYHIELARLLVATGEPVASRGHRLRALELDAGL